MRKQILTFALIVSIAIASFGIGKAESYSGISPKNVIEGNYIEAGGCDTGGAMLGGTSNYTSDSNVFDGTVSFSSTLGVTGAATLSSTLDVSGETSLQGLTSGNGVNQIATTGTAYVMTEAELLADNYFEFTFNTGATAAITFPATSTMTTLLPNAGDTRNWVIHNATSSTMALTLTAGTGIDLIGVTTNDDVIDETEYSELQCWRQPDTDVTCRISELLHVD